MKRIISWIVIITMFVSGFTTVNVRAAISDYKILMTVTLTMDSIGHIGINDPNGGKADVSWVSSDTSIATVDNDGTVYPKKVGTVYMLTTWNGMKYSAKIIIAAADGNTTTKKTTTKKTTTKKTTTTKKKKKVSLSRKSAKIKKGKKIRLKLKNAKASKVQWSSSNKRVAKVSKKGIVKGRRKGTAIIRAKYRGKTYRCKVKVTAKKTVKKLTKTQAYNKLIKYVKKNGKYTSENNFYTVSWESSDIKYQCNYWADQDTFSFTGKFGKGNPTLDITMSINRGSAFKAMYYYNMNDAATRYDMLLEMNQKDMVLDSELNFKFVSGKKQDDRTMKMNANATFQWMFSDFNTYIKKKAGVTMKQLGFKKWA